jgi:hypothetical protein
MRICVEDAKANSREQYLLERRKARKAATAFANVCKAGDADKLYHAACRLNECLAWRLAMVKVARLPRVISEIQAAFHAIWVESKMLPLRVGDRRALASALRILFPCDYSGPPITLYRGTSGGERRRRLYGFSWTTDTSMSPESLPRQHKKRSTQSSQSLPAQRCPRFIKPRG